MGRKYDSPHEKIRQEFEILVGQNNTAFRDMPAYTVAVLFQAVDEVRRKHGVEIAEVHEAHHGIRLLDLDGGQIEEQMAVIGLDDEEHIADLDQIMEIDDRRIGRQYS